MRAQITTPHNQDIHILIHSTMLSKSKATLLLLFFNLLLFSQIEDLEHAKIFDKCQITYTDGHTKDGYIAFFMENKHYDDEDVYSSSVENIFHLDDNNFEFKATIADKPINMTQKDLKRITIYHEDSSVEIYDLMEVKKFDKEKNIIKSSKKAWLPLVKEDVICLYQRNIYVNTIKTNDIKGTEKLKKTKILGTLTYISNKEQNIAFQVYDERKNFLKKNLDSPYLATVLEYVFKDCPTFLEQIMVNKKFKYQQFDTENTEDEESSNNESLTKEEKFIIKDRQKIERESKPFINLIEAYKTTCK